MKDLSKLRYFLLPFLLSACQVVRPSNKEMFQPGDMIDGMRLTTGVKNAAPLWVFCSPIQEFGNTLEAFCTVPPLPQLGIGHVFTIGSEKMSEWDWSELSWELYIDDQSVDLESFGTFEVVLPAVASSPSHIREIFIRAKTWDVVLTNLIPGEHTLKGYSQMGTEIFTWIINLIIEGNNSGKGTSGLVLRFMKFPFCSKPEATLAPYNESLAN